MRDDMKDIEIPDPKPQPFIEVPWRWLRREWPGFLLALTLIVMNLGALGAGFAGAFLGCPQAVDFARSILTPGVPLLPATALGFYVGARLPEWGGKK